MDTDCCFDGVSANFFEDVPEEDELPIHFEIPGPIPYMVDLYAMQLEITDYNNSKKKKETRVSIPEADDHDLPVNFTIPGPIPDLVDLCQQNHKNYSSKPRVSVQNHRTHNNKPRVSVPEDFNIPVPIPTSADYVQKRKTCNNKPSVTRRTTRSCEKISKEKLRNEVFEDIPKFFPKRRTTRSCKK